MHERDGAMGFACQESFETELAVFEARQLPATRKSMADNIDNDAIVKAPWHGKGFVWHPLCIFVALHWGLPGHSPAFVTEAPGAGDKCAERSRSALCQRGILGHAFLF